MMDPRAQRSACAARSLNEVFGTDFSFEDLEERDVFNRYELLGDSRSTTPSAGGSSPSRPGRRSRIRAEV